MSSKKKYKKALITGHFNVLHPGHIRLFKYAKSISETLIVAIEPNEFNSKSIYVDEKERLASLKIIELIDDVFIFKNTIENAIKKAKPDVIIKGNEHKLNENQEKKLEKKFNFDLIFASGESNYTSKDFLSDFSSNQNKIKLPTNFLDRNDLNTNKLVSNLKKFNSIKVLVIGDLIVDEYISCQALGMSQEDPTIVVSPGETKTFIGGAGIVALHSKSLGADVELLTITGNDEKNIYIKNKFKEYKLKHKVFADNSRQTTVKQRFKVGKNTMLRVSKLNTHPINKSMESRIQKYIEKKIDNIDLIIFSDFNYGLITNTLLNFITEIAKERKIIITADSQSSSQIGDISRFKDMDIVSATEREIRIATKDNEDGVVVLIEKLRDLNNAKNVILKLGADGLIIQKYLKDNLQTDQIEALNNNPIDVSGAGDSFLAASSISYAISKNIYLAALIGSVAAAIQVSQIGNLPIPSNKILEAIKY
jgi:rfaE bifunctional protein kinase chain/domain